MAQYLSLLIVRLFVKGRFRKRNLRNKPSQLELGNTSERNTEKSKHPPPLTWWGYFLSRNSLIIILSLKQIIMAKYSKKAQDKVEKVMHEYKHGELKSGKDGKGGTVRSRKQAIAIGLSEAREVGAKVPK